MNLLFHELNQRKEYLSRHKAEDLERVFTELNRYRKELVSPMIMTEEKVYITKKGDYVRSKSEVLLADMYYELGIPYRYEAQLCLKNGKKISRFYITKGIYKGNNLS